MKISNGGIKPVSGERLYLTLGDVGGGNSMRNMGGANTLGDNRAEKREVICNY